jgi:hypothetical protein
MIYRDARKKSMQNPRKAAFFCAFGAPDETNRACVASVYKGEYRSNSARRRRVLFTPSGMARAAVATRSTGPRADLLVGLLGRG